MCAFVCNSHTLPALTAPRCVCAPQSCFTHAFHDVFGIADLSIVRALPVTRVHVRLHCES